MLTINLFNGLVYGALLIVMCSGLALIYGLRRVVNFAHGSLYMLGAYLGYSIAMRSNFWVALVAGPAIMAMLGVLLDRYGFRLLQDRDPLSVVLVTFGLLLIIEDFVQTVWGKSNLSVPAPAALSTSIDLFGTPVPAYRLAVIAVGAGVALGLTLWLHVGFAGGWLHAKLLLVTLVFVFSIVIVKIIPSFIVMFVVDVIFPRFLHRGLMFKIFFSAFFWNNLANTFFFVISRNNNFNDSGLRQRKFLNWLAKL